jgi:cell division FtsZ-interacting protein ZapD
LDLVRKNTKLEEKQALNGFHQELLDPQSNLRLISIIILKEQLAYPEMSVGRHFLSVRFYSPDIHSHPKQHAENIQFWLGYCS